MISLTVAASHMCHSHCSSSLWEEKKRSVVNNLYQTIFQEYITGGDIYTDKKKRKIIILGGKWLLMFACLLVYLFISLFIIWKWLYKLLMLLQIQIHFEAAIFHLIK